MSTQTRTDDADETNGKPKFEVVHFHVIPPLTPMLTSQVSDRANRDGVVYVRTMPDKMSPEISSMIGLRRETLALSKWVPNDGSVSGAAVEIFSSAEAMVAEEIYSGVDEYAQLVQALDEALERQWDAVAEWPSRRALDKCLSDALGFDLSGAGSSS